MHSRHSPGTVLFERYQVVGVLRTGTHGNTYHAGDLKTGKMVLVKELLARDQMADLEKLAQDIQAPPSQSISGLAANIETRWDSDRFILVREFVEGLDAKTELHERLAANGSPFPAPLAVRIAIQVAVAVEGLHNLRPRPLVHGNIKPSNILTRSRDQSVVLVDFGLSWRLTNGNAGRTQFGQAGFAPLEQFVGAPSVRSDQYALGASLHCLLSGKTPLPNHLPPLSGFPDLLLPLELCEVVARATQPRLEDRFESMLEFRRCLERLLPQL